MGVYGLVVVSLFAGQALGATKRSIDVQVYNSAGASKDEIRRALQDAGFILGAAGVQVQWSECINSEADASPRSCGTQEPGYRLSIVEEDPRGPHVRDALGFAVLAGRRNGAVVIYSRIVSMVQNHPNYADCDILGNVIAHELGHLLLSSAEHGEGVMKATWMPHDFEAMKQRALRFSKATVTQLAATEPPRRLANSVTTIASR